MSYIQHLKILEKEIKNIKKILNRHYLDNQKILTTLNNFEIKKNDIFYLKLMMQTRILNYCIVAENDILNSLYELKNDLLKSIFSQSKKS